MSKSQKSQHLSGGCFSEEIWVLPWTSSLTTAWGGGFTLNGPGEPFRKAHRPPHLPACLSAPLVLSSAQSQGGLPAARAPHSSQASSSPQSAWAAATPPSAERSLPVPHRGYPRLPSLEQAGCWEMQMQGLSSCPLPRDSSACPLPSQHGRRGPAVPSPPPTLPFLGKMFHTHKY